MIFCYVINDPLCQSSRKSLAARGPRSTIANQSSCTSDSHTFIYVSCRVEQLVRLVNVLDCTSNQHSKYEQSRQILRWHH